MEIKDILEKGEYEQLNKFTAKEIKWLNNRIRTRKDGKAGVECIARGLNKDKDYFELKPEEIVRQLYAHQLMENYGYPKELLDFEVSVTYHGRERVIDDKRIDIAIYENDKKKKISVIVEVKRPNVSDENKTYENESATPREQLRSYCLQKQAQVGVIVNGGKLLKFYGAPDFEHALSLTNFPQYKEKLDDWKNGQRFTIKQLMLHDRLNHETLKEVISDVEQRFGANDSSDKAFDEIFKLIFTKLYDEKMSADDADKISTLINSRAVKLEDIDDSQFRVLKFRAEDSDSADEATRTISDLFELAKQKWSGVFPSNSKLAMQKTTIQACVQELQNVKLFNSNLEVVDEAFEQLVNKGQKGDMGQYFTPRYVIDMCVKMLNPSPDDKMIDTAAGSCGFPMHTIFHSWNIMNPEANNLFTTKRSQTEEEYVRKNIYGIDFSEKSVRIGRMLNIIAGDGHSNVIELNTLDYENWTKDYVNNEAWSDKYSEGFKRLKQLSRKPNHHSDSERFKSFDFDIVMANPPFAGDLTNKEQLRQYQLGRKNGDKTAELQNKVGRDILFIERNINFLKPGGRMAVVLPQGRFNNAAEKYIREYILERCRLLAVVGLHQNVFKPHTGTKTSVLFVQKWTDEGCGYPNICPKSEKEVDGEMDYPIFFATMQEPSKDNSGDKIYVSENYVRWNSYEYETVEVITRKIDGLGLTHQEFKKEQQQKGFKKSDFKFQTLTQCKKTEHKNSAGETRFIKDLFVEQYGEVNDHKKWQKENIAFILKKNRQASGQLERLSIDDYLDLSSEQKKSYKKTPLIGKNRNPILTYNDFQNLTREQQRYYKVVEEVIEGSERVKDTHGHIFVKHDLFNHDPKLENKNHKNIYSQDGIAEAFIEFAKKEKLSFFR